MTTMYERMLDGADVGTALAAAQAGIRTMNAGRRDQAYEKLRAEVDGETAAARPRDLGEAAGGAADEAADGAAAGGAAGDAGLPAHWAPFIHIGG
jgi:hypothetical protein